MLAFYDGAKRCHTLITLDDDSILAEAAGGFSCGVLLQWMFVLVRR